MAGKKRKPDVLKKIAGTFQKSRANQNAPTPPTDIPTAPARLSERGAEIFEDLVSILAGMKIASSADVNVITLCAQRLEDVEVLTAIIEDLGRTCKSQTKTKGGDVVEMIRARPEVAMRDVAMRHAHSLLAELGLTPVARSKVTATPETGKNKFGAI